MSGLNGMNGDWRQGNRAPVYFSDEEVFQLSHIDETWNEPSRYPGGTIIDHEMQCQRDMRVRGKRLWLYHLKIGDLYDILGFIPRPGFTPLTWEEVAANAEYNSWPLNIYEAVMQ